VAPVANPAFAALTGAIPTIVDICPRKRQG
jgi:hypothetical protein